MWSKPALAFQAWTFWTSSFFCPFSGDTIEWHLPRHNHSAPSHPCPQKKLIIHPLLLNCKHSSSESWIIWNQYWLDLNWKTGVALWVNLVLMASCAFSVIVKWKEEPCVYRWFWVQSSPACSRSKELEKLTVSVRHRAWLDVGWVDSYPSVLISIRGASKLL